MSRLSLLKIAILFGIFCAVHFKVQDSYECEGYYEFGALMTLLACIIYPAAWRILCSGQNRSARFQSVASQKIKN